MTLLDIYYVLKPLVPRRLQICLRRVVAKKKWMSHRSSWPIDRRAAQKPEGWHGWPGGKQFALVLNHDVDTDKGCRQSGLLRDLERNLSFRSSFFFVAEGYSLPEHLLKDLSVSGFDVGVHGLRHDGKMFRSRKIFEERASRINRYLEEWQAIGFSSPSMHRKLDWMGDLDIAFDLSTFDTDPFEPQPQGVGTIFPFWVSSQSRRGGFVELPYTLPQDHTLFVILRMADNRIWKEKLDWIADNGGMALINTHPDYMKFGGGKCASEEYPVKHYLDLLEYVESSYGGRYWHALAVEVSEFWARRLWECSLINPAHLALYNSRERIMPGNPKSARE